MGETVTTQGRIIGPSVDLVIAQRPAQTRESEGRPMTEHVLFIQGAGSGAYDEDRRLADSLQRVLGPHYDVRYPAMPNEDDAPYEQWRQQIEQALADVPGPAIFVGHSVGA